MINKETGQEIEPIEYGIDEEDIQRRAEQNLLSGNREYQKLVKEFEKYDYRRDYAKACFVKQRIMAMTEIEINRLWKLEIDRRKNIRAISEVLLEKDRDEYDRWQELLAGLSFVMDMIDYTVRDINELLRRNNLGVKLEKFKEIEGARALANRLTGDNMKHSSDWQVGMWMEESDRLWDYMKERCATYRRKVDRKLARSNDHRDK